jgi:hypothetical protein
MLSEADFADAILKVFGAAEDFDFDAHEVNRQIAPINLGKSNGVLLRRDNRFSKFLFAAIDAFDDFELGESMVIGEFARIDQLRAELNQAFLEALGLRNPAQRGNLSALKEVEPDTVASKNVFEVERMMNALDDACARIDFGNAASEFVGFAIALRYEDPLGASEVRGRLAQCATRKQALIAERRLAVHQNDVVAASFQFPILEAVIEQQCVATVLFDGVTAAFNAIFVDENDDVSKIGSEHVWLVASHFRIEQQ